MTKEEIFEYITKNPMFSLATVENNKPHVRYMMLFRADDNGVIFMTTALKDLYKQLQANPAIEMCFGKADELFQIRISGSVEEMDDLGLKKEIVEQLPFLKPLVEEKGYEVIITFRVKEPKALCWSMESNFEPKKYIEL